MLSLLIGYVLSFFSMVCLWYSVKVCRFDGIEVFLLLLFVGLWDQKRAALHTMNTSHFQYSHRWRYSHRWSCKALSSKCSLVPSTCSSVNSRTLITIWTFARCQRGIPSTLLKCPRSYCTEFVFCGLDENFKGGSETQLDRVTRSHVKELSNLAWCEQVVVETKRNLLLPEDSFARWLRWVLVDSLKDLQRRNWDEELTASITIASYMANTGNVTRFCPLESYC